MVTSPMIAHSSIFSEEHCFMDKTRLPVLYHLAPLLQESESETEIDTISDKLQGKVVELRMELGMGGKKDKNHSAKKIALKKIVANMNMSNNDMVALFPDVINCMTIQSLEIKKMFIYPESSFSEYQLMGK